VRYTTPLFSVVLIDLMTFFFSFAKQLSSETRLLHCFQLFWLILWHSSSSLLQSSFLRKPGTYFIAVVFLIYNKWASCEWVVGGTKAERNHSKALTCVHLLCQSISHDSCVIQKTTQTLLENCGSFPTKSTKYSYTSLPR
jgi:hypothetical protein